MTTLDRTTSAVYPVEFPVDSIDSVSGIWWIAYTKSRHEKAFAAELKAAGIASYLPITSRWGILDGKRQMVHQPTFPGYCFFACRGKNDSPEYAVDMYAVKGNHRIVTLIEIRDQKLFVRELGQIQRALQDNPSLGSCMYLVPGKRCRVTKGAYIGYEGKLEANSKGVFHLVVSAMQSSIELQLPDETYLEPLE